MGFGSLLDGLVHAVTPSWVGLMPVLWGWKNKAERALLR